MTHGLVEGTHPTALTFLPYMFGVNQLKSEPYMFAAVPIDRLLLSDSLYGAHDR